MGRRKRLIVQADLTSEEDQTFLAWVHEQLRRRRLSEAIRLGLRVQYDRSTGQATPAYPSYPGEINRLVQHYHSKEYQTDGQALASDAGTKVHRLVQRF